MKKKTIQFKSLSHIHSFRVCQHTRILIHTVLYRKHLPIRAENQCRDHYEVFVQLAKCSPVFRCSSEKRAKGIEKA